jgi:hypothetical protein
VAADARRRIHLKRENATSEPMRIVAADERRLSHPAEARALLSSGSTTLVAADVRRRIGLERGSAPEEL